MRYQANFRMRVLWNSMPPPVMTREEQVARKIQEREISAAAAQNKTEAASARFAQAFPHADKTDFAQLSSDAQPRPASKTLATRPSQPVPNALHYAMSRSPKMATQIHAPRSALPPCGAQIRTVFSLLVISVRKLPCSKTRSPSAGSEQLPIRMRFRACVPPWAVTSDFAPSLPRASRTRSARPTWNGDVLLSVWSKDKT